MTRCGERGGRGVHRCRHAARGRAGRKVKKRTTSRASKKAEGCRARAIALALPGVGRRKLVCLGREHPPGQRGEGHGLQVRNEVELRRERLFARLVPKHRAPGIGTGRPAQQCPEQQRRFPDAPPPVLRPRLVDPERGESDEVQRDERGREVGGVDEGGSCQAARASRSLSLRASSSRNIRAEKSRPLGQASAPASMNARAK